MMKLKEIKFKVLLLVILLLPSLGRTEPQLFDHFWSNVESAFTGENIYFHLLGAASTPLLIKSGVDAQVYANFRQTTNEAAWPGAVIGSGVVAIGAGLWLYWKGHSGGDGDLIRGAFAIGQASLITVTYVMFLKALTGRAHPANWSPLSPQEQSEDFIFDFKKPLTGYGWPSGHVSHTVAVTTALSSLYPEKNWLKWLGIGLSSYMLYTVSAFNSAQMHWFSDGIAGGFMGFAIGKSVGEGWRMDAKQNHEAAASSFYWYPLVSKNTFALFGILNF